METFHFDAPFGPIQITCDHAAVHAIHLLPDADGLAPQSALACHVARELEQYFRDSHFVFTVPLRVSGTDFQQRLWQALRAIPVGEVRRYGELSALIGGSARAIGGACRQNPLPVIVPCHRVVSAAGDGGFAGAVDGPLLTIKRWLLNHEGARRPNVEGQTGDLFAAWTGPH